MAFTGRLGTVSDEPGHSWDDPAEDERTVRWARDAFAIVEPHSTMGRYVNDVADSGARPRPLDLRRRQIRPTRRGQAGLGSGQRVPAEPEHQALVAAKLTGACRCAKALLGATQSEWSRRPATRTGTCRRPRHPSVEPDRCRRRS